MIKHDEYIIGELELDDYSSIFAAAGKTWTMTGQLSFSASAAVKAATLTTEIGLNLNISKSRGTVGMLIRQQGGAPELVLTFKCAGGFSGSLLGDVKRLCSRLEIPPPRCSRDAIDAVVEVADHNLNLTPDSIRIAKDNLERQSLVEQLYTALLEKHAQARTHLYELKEREQQLLAYQNQLRYMSSELALSEEHERKRLATALHDSVIQSMSATIFKTRVLVDMLENDEGKSLLKQIRSEFIEELQVLRFLTFELSPPILYELGLSAAIEWLGENLQKDGVSFSFVDHGEPPDMDQSAKIMAFQFVREMLANVRKHAEASSIVLSQTVKDDRLSIVVTDNGRGFDPADIIGAAKKKCSFGLMSIRERVKQVGGEMTIESRAGKGTKIALSLPFRVAAPSSMENNRVESDLLKVAQ